MRINEAAAPTGINFPPAVWLFPARCPMCRYPCADGESKPKAKKEAAKKGKGGKKKKKKGSDSEALEDSDDGDFEGLEVDYMSDDTR